MSEYQRYDFLAVDRPLQAEELAALRAISTRAEISPTRFVNEYSFGSLKADPRELLTRYFDVFVYEANWGTRRLMLRVPADAVASRDLLTYCIGPSVMYRTVGKQLVLEIRSETEDYGSWVQPRDWMTSLWGVRTELMQGDVRVLYLAWLLQLEQGAGDAEEKEEPPVPPGLGALSASLSSLVEFLRLDPYLVAAAAEASSAAIEADEGLARWIADLPGPQKDGMLLQVAQGAHAQVAAKLMREFRGRPGTVTPQAERVPRTAAALFERADALREIAQRRQARADAAAKKKREAAAAAAKNQRLDLLAARQPDAWREVEALVGEKKQSSYDTAVSLLSDLRDLAARDGHTPEYVHRLGAVRERHAAKHSFVARLKKAGL